MANSRDFTGKNRKFTGTKGITTPKGTTDQRVGSESGELRFNTTTELMEYYDGNQWKPIDAPPSVTSVSSNDSVGTSTVLNADGSTYTISITGGNFGIGANVKFIGNTGIEYTAGNINRVSASSITCTTLVSMGTTDDPYDVQVINASGLSATLEDAFTYNAAPVFATASGTLGDVWNGRVVSGSTLNASATDAEGNTITYSIVSGSLPGSGLSISSSTGLITGTLSGTPSLAVYSFTVRAATSEGNSERAFSIQVIATPFVAATGGTVVTSGNYKIHTFTGPGSFIVSNAGGPLGSNTVDYLVLAGGGSGGQNNGGGGGAGGFREAKSPMNASPHTASPLATTTGVTVTAQTYPITVGGGGNFGPSSGSPSVFATITSAGGGGAARDSSNGTAGGSGGGGGHDVGTAASGGAGNSPPVSPPQGNNGGPVTGSGAGWTGGGGGGATAAAGTASPGGGGGGGAGATTSISDSPVAYAGGGGGSSDGGTQGAGGTPTAGSGGNGGGPGSSATSNFGGGGGGSDGGTPGNGGSGIVIIRYKFQ
jgi:hypothetical protein